MPEPTPIPPHRRRRWFSLSIRGLMLVILVLGGLMGWKARRASLQRRAVARIWYLEGNVRYDWQPKGVFDIGAPAGAEPPGPVWLRRILGDEYFQEVVYVSLPSVWQTYREDIRQNKERTEALEKDELSCLDGLDRIETLELWGPALKSEGLARLGRLSSLKELQSMFTSMETEGLAQIARLSRLEKLRVRVKFSDDAELAVLEKLHSLQELSLYDDNTEQEPLSLGQTAPSVSTNSAHFTDASLAQLARLTSLTALYLDDSSRITDAGLAHLKNLRSLEHIDLEGATSISDVGMAHLKGLTSLRHLNFSSATEIGDDGLAQLKDLKKLERLDLDSTTKTTDAGVAHLEKLEHLEWIGLASASKLTDACVESLAKLPGLWALDLNAKSLTDQGLNRLQTFRSLKGLTLTGVKIKGKILDDINAAIPGIRIDAERIDDGEEVGAPTVPSPPSGRSPSDGASPPVIPRS